MNCPKCGAEASGEFCPSCLAQVGAPEKKAEEVEAEVARKEAEAKAQEARRLHRSGRQVILWAGAVVVAVTLGIAIAAIIEEMSEPRQEEAAFKEPRVPCGRPEDCGTDTCGRPMRCAGNVCTRIDDAPCQAAQGPLP